MYTRQGNSKQKLGSFEAEDGVSRFFKTGPHGSGGRLNGFGQATTDCASLGTAYARKMTAYATAMSTPSTIANGAALLAEAEGIKTQMKSACPKPLWKRPAVLVGVGVAAVIGAVVMFR